MKLKTYKLKDLQYAGLSLSYLLGMAIVLLLTIALAALFSQGGNWLGLAACLSIGGGGVYYIYYVGIRYGQYGLTIICSNMLRPRHLKNDFPLIQFTNVSILPNHPIHSKNGF